MNFDAVKFTLFGGKLIQEQVNGINTLLDEAHKIGITDKRQLAYILATVHHETGKQYRPIKEFGGEKYLLTKAYYPYYGRDLCQTTWKANYEKVKKFSGIDVVTHPELIGQMPLAAHVCVMFMSKGWYTGKKLSDYFNDTKEDWLGARKIINGSDKKELIASYGKVFLSAL
ncbi:MAG: hypothetical protein WC810_14600 [Janthinobacterium sp.]|jgi:predicted chitinase